MKKTLKNFSTNILLKILAFITILICCFMLVKSYLKIYDNVIYYDAVFYNDYYQSGELTDVYNKIVKDIKNMMKFYTEENTIKSNMNKNYSYENNLEFEFEETLRYRINKFKSFVNSLDKMKGIYYYATNGGAVYKNSANKSKEFFSSFPSYLLIEYNDIEIYPSNIYIPYVASDMGYNTNEDSKVINKANYKIYISITSSYLQPLIEKWNFDKALVLNESIKMIAELCIAFVALMYLFTVTGIKAEEKEIQLNFVDKLYTDINLFIFIGLLLYFYYEIIDIIRFYSYDNNIKASLCVLMLSLLLVLTLSMIRHIKNKTIIKHSLAYIVLPCVYYGTEKLLSKGTVTLKLFLAIIVYSAILVAGMYICPIFYLVIFVAFYYIYKYSSKLVDIKNGIEKVKDGNLNYKISISGNSELTEMAKNINSITEGLNKAVKNEVTSERMKSELITNVSHDIKTPLTSIINYVDLLKKEGFESENAQKYLSIIDQKSIRLKTLTEDLFEAAKASSGNMPVELECVDLHSLIQQGLAELEDKIEEAKLEFRIKAPNYKIFVEADGKLLWRVIENLFSNVFKYALAGSRVYIEIFDSNAQNNAILTIKNISAYELNIPAEELMERFKRADLSRTTEGSGLGLAIAKNLIEIQNGRLQLAIDGDLFKAIVSIPKYAVEVKFS